MRHWTIAHWAKIVDVGNFTTPEGEPIYIQYDREVTPRSRAWVQRFDRWLDDTQVLGTLQIAVPTGKGGNDTAYIEPRSGAELAAIAAELTRLAEQWEDYYLEEAS